MNTPDNFAEKNSGITPSSFSTGWLKDIELLVPLYQRLFVWEEEQIIQFLEDLQRAFRENRGKPYYIGTVTVYRRLNEPITWELVDGQQRLTMLTLVGGCSADKSLWHPFLFKDSGAKARLQYFARPDDQEDLRKIVKDGCAANQVANPNMKRFVGLFGRLSEKADFMRDFSKFVYEKVTALVAFLPESYGLNDLNLYYEKMNSEGKQLEAHEILKGRYLGKYSTRWNAVAKLSEPYPPKNEIEVADVELTLELFLNSSDDPEKYGPEPPTAAITPDPSRLVMSFPVFLLHCVAICFPDNVEENIPGFLEPKHLLSTFKVVKERWEGKRRELFADAFVREMESYRKWMDKWIIHIDDERPVSPYYAGEYELAYAKGLWQFQSMLHVSGGEQQKWVLDAYLGSRSNELSDVEFLAMLKRQDRNRHPLNIGDKDCPSDFSYGEIDRYWFWKLDYILWETRISLPFVDKAQKAVDSYTFRRNRSIEHLHPQTSDAPWEPKDLHSFGNLAMISASFNSQQG